jgi:hypothetical protein
MFLSKSITNVITYTSVVWLFKCYVVSDVSDEIEKICLL